MSAIDLPAPRRRVVASEQIWQCVGCGRTFVEYVNGCPHHGDVEIAPRVELVVEHRAEEERA